jgi:hypothetical protein
MVAVSTIRRAPLMSMWLRLGLDQRPPNAICSGIARFWRHIRKVAQKILSRLAHAWQLWQVNEKFKGSKHGEYESSLN